MTRALTSRNAMSSPRTSDTPSSVRTEENALWSMGPHDFSMVLGLTGAEPDSVAAIPVRVVNPAVLERRRALG